MGSTTKDGRGCATPTDGLRSRSKPATERTAAPLVVGRTRRLAATLPLVAVMALAAGCGGSSKPSEEQLVAQVRPSVVELTGTEAGSTVGGSGVVIDATRGLVLTNAHVVTGLASLMAKVGDNSATQTPARVVASAPCDDLAVVKLVNVPPGLQGLPFGSSASVKNGDTVTALGYPASFQNPTQENVVSTVGIVSSPNVPADPDPSLPHYPSTIQHQAPINPGNSGGPLVNDRGQLIGINTLGNTQQGGRAIQGQYYAISIDHIRSVLPGLEAGHNVAYAGWDLVPIQNEDLSLDFAQDQTFASASVGRQVQNRLQAAGQHGLYVRTSATNSPAANVNIGDGDMIFSIEGQPVASVADVCSILQSHGSGDKLRVRGLYLNSASSLSQVLDRWHATITLR